MLLHDWNTSIDDTFWFLFFFFLLGISSWGIGFDGDGGGGRGGGHFRKNCRTKGCPPTKGNPGIITHSCCEHITGGVNIYLYGRVILLAPECAVCLCLCVCVISNQRLASIQIMCQTSVNLTTCCTKCTAMSFQY